MSFLPGQITTKSPLELIHVDTWGPYRASTYNNYRYFLTITDDFSRSTWTFHLSTKSNEFTILQSFSVIAERKLERNIKIIRSDNAWELGKSDTGLQFFRPKGILQQTSCVSIPQ